MLEDVAVEVADFQLGILLSKSCDQASVQPKAWFTNLGLKIFEQDFQF